MSYYPEHTVEPEVGTIRQAEGIDIGNDTARCQYCGLPIEGNDRGWWHTEPEEATR